MLSSWRYVVVGMVVCFALSTNVQAAIQVYFDQDEYIVQPGHDFQVQVLLDADDAQAGTQTLAGGLFSMGIRVTFGSDKANLADITAIVLPDEINGDGVGGPAFKEVGSGFAGAAGAVSLSALDVYHETLLATITVSDLDFGQYPYELSLSQYYGAGKTDFMDGNGTDLDNVITFGTATVVPEPITLSFMAFGSLALLRRRER